MGLKIDNSKYVIKDKQVYQKSGDLYVTNQITVDGVVYTLEDRKAKAGEKVLIVDAQITYSNYNDGDIFSVSGDYSHNAVDVVENDAICLLHKEYVVLVPVANPITTQQQIEQKRKELEELEAQLKQEQRLKVGDYAKVLDNRHANGFENTSAKIGDIVKITNVDDDNRPYRGDRLDGMDFDWYRESTLVRATDEEVQEALKQLEQQQQQKALEQKWANIGRKVNEYKVGDVVQLVSMSLTYHGLKHHVGIVTTITNVDTDNTVLLKVPNGVTRYDESHTWTEFDDIRLITPVEQLFTQVA